MLLTKTEYKKLMLVRGRYIRGKPGVVCRAYSDHRELKEVIRKFVQ